MVVVSTDSRIFSRKFLSRMAGRPNSRMQESGAYTCHLPSSNHMQVPSNQTNCIISLRLNWGDTMNWVAGMSTAWLMTWLLTLWKVKGSMCGRARTTMVMFRVTCLPKVYSLLLNTYKYSIERAFPAQSFHLLSSWVIWLAVSWLPCKFLRNWSRF